MCSKIKPNLNSWFIIDFNYILKECYYNIILDVNDNTLNILSKVLLDKVKTIILEIINIRNENKNVIIVYDNKLNESIKECYNIIDTYIINFFNSYDFIYYNNNTYNNTDVIAIISNIILNNNIDIIKIISNNKILYQLISDKILILNMYGKEDTLHILSSGKINLWYNIINGLDTKLQFNINFISYFLSSNKNDLDWNNNNDLELEYRCLTKKNYIYFYII